MTEIEGKTIDEAIEKACSEFGVPREKLNVEIVSEGSQGFFGLGAKRAKIRARLLSIHMAEETFEKPVIKAAAVQPVVDAVIPPPRKEGRPVKRETAREHIRETIREPVRDSPREHIRGTTRGPVTEITTETARETSKEPAREHNQETDDELAMKAKTLLSGILERMNIEAPVTADAREDAIVLNIQGDGGGLLIGKRGQNLDALQYIVNKATNRSGEDRKMIVIDTEAYRKRREDALVSLAERLGQKVKKTRKAVTVSHMNAHDRRIIHLTLQTDSSLTTKSRGEGEYRKIIIMPARSERERAVIKPTAN
ncbi:MAG: Jag N-terminal domain-containing protein [Deltaproteobacteria bacterium]|nr:Jag N-terminal domain-containing protein [Deltaproteobacteria bacterium]